ncbi:hypothetical protein HS1genome_1719 [Sulfodiicoccus acidiphilus]|uniref:Microtubule-binding protein n=1 Tax=Sulfodiicoccus acidiphilus TaxID=1670455 RepID=A0A348B578_9CREN|nr:hypothetical protein [Sulfodiicoccus acidiphilus]BBD73330.1 hypothetical protein HS1genome_1719 [Sulfodiicoccus acidiphilus]
MSGEIISRWFAGKIDEIAAKITEGKTLAPDESTMVLYYLMKEEVVKESVKTREAVRDLETRLTSRIDAVERNLTAGQKSLEANQKSLEANQKSLEANQKSLEANQKSLEANQKSLEANQKSLEANQKSLEANQKSLDNKIDSNYAKLNKAIEQLRSDLGLVAEETFMNRVLGFLERKGEKVVDVDRGVETPRGEVDAVIVCEGKVYVVEVKLKVELSDVDEVKSRAVEVEKSYGLKALPVITGARMGKHVKTYATGIGVITV